MTAALANVALNALWVALTVATAWNLRPHPRPGTGPYGLPGDTARIRRGTIAAALNSLLVTPGGLILAVTTEQGHWRTGLWIFAVFAHAGILFMAVMIASIHRLRLRDTAHH